VAACAEAAIPTVSPPARRTHAQATRASRPESLVMVVELFEIM
jgi:hypothetical protein